MKFERIVDQEKAKQSILDSIHGGRLAHALILKGPEGTGKLAMANSIAQYINCENPSETDSCGVCANCSKISKGIHPDIRYVLPIISATIDGKKAVTDDFFAQFRERFFDNPYLSFQEWMTILQGENKQAGIHIHEIRTLKRKLSLKAFEAKYKVVIFWNAEKINVEASNALLKLLEEPPERTILILTVTDQSQLLSTINSRCQRVQVNRVNEQKIVDFLVNTYSLEPAHAEQLAQLAEGSIGKAAGLANQTNQDISDNYRTWMRLCYEGNYAKINDWVEQISRESKEFQKLFLNYSIQKIRDSLLFSFQADDISLAAKEEKEFQKKFSEFVSLNGINEISKLLDNSLYFVSRNANSKMVFSVLSLRIHSLLAGKVLI